MKLVRLGSLICVIALVAGCGGGEGGGTDGGGDAGEPDGAEACSLDSECDDGTFCNGTEQCAPADPASDARGCVAGPSPCEEGCDEEANVCPGGCPDADGDGSEDAACGGDDCDDADPDRYPGNTEVCDSVGLDEDCDPTTLGDDADADGYVSDECCNQQDDGSLLCGADCDDGSEDVNPETTDLCGNGDQDCDGTIDEDPSEVFYVDMDGDGYGDATDTVVACSAPDGYATLAMDCRDDDPEVNPGVEERCDAGLVDENCDGMANDGCSCTTGETQQCGTTEVGACSYGTQTCVLDGDGGSIWGTCNDAVEPEAEVCNGIDDDCNGTVDDLPDAQCIEGETSTGINACGREGSRSCDPGTCRWDPQEFSLTETVSTCDYCDDTTMGLGSEAAVATATRTHTVGTTDLVPSTPDAIDFSSFDGTNYAAALYAPSAADTADPLDIGYGTITFRAQVTVVEPSLGDDVLHGWAMVVAKEDTSSPNPLFGNAGFRLGVPWGRDGFSVEWRFYDVDDSTNVVDSLVMRHITDGGVDPRIDQASSVGPRADSDYPTDTRDQELRITIEPDLPDDGSDDTAVVVEYLQGGSWNMAMECGGSAAACPFSIVTGERYYFGVTLSRAGETRVLVDVGEITREGLCP